MSTENNVNRVNSSFNVEAEKAKLEPKPELAVDDGYRTPTDDPMVKLEESNKLLEQDPEALKSAWGELTKSAPLIDKLLDTPAIQEGIKEQGLQVNEDVIAQFRSLVGGDDLKVFRSQVIRAFKHIGIDSKKFFGE